MRTRRGIASLCRSRGARRGEAVMACPVWARHGRASLGGSWKGAAVKAGLGMAEQVEAWQVEAWPGRPGTVPRGLARHRRPGRGCRDLGDAAQGQARPAAVGAGRGRRGSHGGAWHVGQRRGMAVQAWQVTARHGGASCSRHGSRGKARPGTSRLGTAVEAGPGRSRAGLARQSRRSASRPGDVWPGWQGVARLGGVAGRGLARRGRRGAAPLGMARPGSQREARRREVWPGRVTAVVATLARACRGEAAEASDGAATSGMAWRSNKGR